MAAPIDLSLARPLAWYQPGRRVETNQRAGAGGAAGAAGAASAGAAENYVYELAAAPGRGFAPGFRPQKTPAQMLSAGVFEGKYLNDCAGEFPREWFAGALRRGRLLAAADPAVNAFGLKSRLSLGEWRRRGWLVAPDPRGWFQWYCRYWIGRREPAVDAHQIARWRAFARHRGQILAAYGRLRAARKPVPATPAEKRAHRARQRQALLQWAYDPYV